MDYNLYTYIKEKINTFNFTEEKISLSIGNGWIPTESVIFTYNYQINKPKVIDVLLEIKKEEFEIKNVIYELEQLVTYSDLEKIYVNSVLKHLYVYRKNRIKKYLNG